MNILDETFILKKALCYTHVILISQQEVIHEKYATSPFNPHLVKYNLCNIINGSQLNNGFEDRFKQINN